MRAAGEDVLSTRQLQAFQEALHRGALEASEALTKWFGKPARISHDAVEQLPLQDATDVLGVDDEPMCFCVAAMTGRITGQLILAFDDSSGWALADMLLDQPRGTASQWLDMETSAALETTNILGCAYLNSLTRVLPPATSGSCTLIPSPPRFSRDFAESLIEFALMAQVMATDHVLLARTRFEIDNAPVNWTLLFVPDAQSMSTLRALLQ